jgi:hypothetical protein
MRHSSGSYVSRYDRHCPLTLSWASNITTSQAAPQQEGIDLRRALSTLECEPVLQYQASEWAPPNSKILILEPRFHSPFSCFPVSCPVLSCSVLCCNIGRAKHVDFREHLATCRFRSRKLQSWNLEASKSLISYSAFGIQPHTFPK